MEGMGFPRRVALNLPYLPQCAALPTRSDVGDPVAMTSEIDAIGMRSAIY